MPARPATKPRRLPYWISFTAFTLFLGGLTVAFVLGVLRQRFVLHAGLRESGVSFPTGPAPFTVQERAMVRPNLAIPGTVLVDEFSLPQEQPAKAVETAPQP